MFTPAQHAKLRRQMARKEMEAAILQIMEQGAADWWPPRALYNELAYGPPKGAWYKLRTRAHKVAAVRAILSRMVKDGTVQACFAETDTEEPCQKIRVYGLADEPLPPPGPGLRLVWWTRR